MTEEQLLEKLLEEYPNGEISNISKSWLYYDIKKMAEINGMTVTNYLNDIGFTLTRGSHLDEEKTIEELMNLFPDGKIYSLAKHYKLQQSLMQIATEQGRSMQELLSDYGLEIVRKQRVDAINDATPVKIAMLEKEKYLEVTKYDEFLMKELIDDYNFIISDFATYLGISRQAAYAKMKRVKKSSFSWEVDELPSEHFQFFKKMLKEEVNKDESETHYYCISYSQEKNQFAFTLYPKDLSDFPMCLSDESIPEDIVQLLFEKEYHIFNTRDFLTLQDLRTSPAEDYSGTGARLSAIYRNLVLKHYDYHMNILKETTVYYPSDSRGAKFEQFAKHKNLDYIKDSRIITDEEIRTTLEGFRNPITNLVKIPIDDPQYHRFVNLAKHRGYNLKNFIESFGFNYRRIREFDEEYKEKRKLQRLRRLENYKVTDDAVYISSYSKLYNHLTNLGRLRGYNLTEYLWEEFGLKRVEYKDLPEGYVPYELGDYEEDLDREEQFLQIH